MGNGSTITLNNIFSNLAGTTYPTVAGDPQNWKPGRVQEYSIGVQRELMRSLRGRSGGYLLGRQPKNITFAEVIRTIDGPLALSPCVSTTAYHKCEDCDDEETCAIRKVLLAARDATAAILEERTLAGAMPARRRTRAAA